MIPTTKKLYLQQPYLSECTACVVDIIGNGIVLDQTVAFPESGGQEGDQGCLIFGWNNGRQKIIPFYDTRKEIRRLILFPDFSLTQEDCPIFHFIDDELLHYFIPGSSLLVKIDVQRRARLLANRTGLNLVLMGLEQLYPNIYASISGCYIGEDNAQLDFFAKERFSSEEIKAVAQFVNLLVDMDIKIKQYTQEAEPDVRFWQCQNIIYHSGGTYLLSTKNVGKVFLKRRTIGRRLERIIASFPEATLPLERYYSKGA